MADHIGQRFGDYHLIRFLGNGTFGDVYFAEQVDRKTPAAVKVFKSQLTPDFIDEVRTVLLKHPHIIPILDFGVERREKEAIPYLVMEYAPNGTLLQRYPRGTCLPLDTIVLYVQQIAAALQYAHDHKRIHRDVKPENLLLGAHDEVLLSDFGIAAVAHTTSSQRTGETLGTAPYMAPEQWQGKPLPASDQYSLAVVVYEWICGERPFQGGSHQLMYQHSQLPPPPLHTKVAMISAEVEQVVMTALSKEPHQRFATVQAFATALAHASQPEPNTELSDRESSLSTSSSTFVRPHDTSTFLLLRPDEAGADTERQAMPPGDTGLEASLPPGREYGSSLHTSEPGLSREPMRATAAKAPVLPSSSSKVPTPPQFSSANGGKGQLSFPVRSRPSRRHILMVCAVLLSLVVSASLLPRLWVGKGANSPQPGSTQTSSAGTTSTAALVAPGVATAAAQRYDQGVTTNGVMFGFDAGHTNTNPYEQVLSPTTVPALKLVWSSPETNFQSSPTIAYGRVYIGAHDGNLYAFDAQTRKFLWKQPTGGAIEATPAVADGMVFVGSDDGRLYAFDAQRGTPRWSADIGVNVGPPTNRKEYVGSPTVANGLVFVTTNDTTFCGCANYLYALTTKGMFSWKMPVYDQVSAPAAANGTVYITFGSTTVVAYKATTGQQLWTQSIPGEQHGSDPAVGDGLVYVNTIGSLYAFDANTGKQSWVSQGGAGDIAIDGEAVYMSDNGLRALDAKTGNQLEPPWTVLAQEGAGSPMIANGVIYDCSVDGNLYAFNLKTKAPLWSTSVYPSGYSSTFPPTPVVANGTVYINVWDNSGSSAGQLLAFGLPG